MAEENRYRVSELIIHCRLRQEVIDAFFPNYRQGLKRELDLALDSGNYEFVRRIQTRLDAVPNLL